MINTELMIGNWINYYGKNVCIAELKEKGISYLDKPLRRYLTTAPYSEFNPIPLTEEILLKCGFEHITEGLRYADKNHLIVNGDKDWLFMPFCTNDIDCYIPIKYLHQLQNLYFALTGEELEFKL
jgi:hypothetical protein